MPADPNAYLSSTRNLADGDHDFMQTVFFEVPDTLTSTLYFAVNNPASTGVTPDQGASTHMARFNLFGGPGCYSDPAARSNTVAGNDKYIGNMLDWHWDDEAGWSTAGWAYFDGVSPSQGEHIGNKYYFKITVEATGGAPTKNSYQYDVSYTNTGSPTGVSTIRAFAYILGVAFVKGGGRSYPFYPFIPDTDTGSIVAWNLDFDNNNTGTMYDYANTPQGAITASTDSATASTSFAIGAAQRNATWKAVYTEGAAGTDVIDMAEVWFKNSLTGQLYPIYATPYSAPTPDHVIMAFSKEVVVPPLGFNSYSSDGVAIADNNDTVTVNLQVVDYNNSPLPVARNIYVTVNNGGTITAVNAGSTNNTTTAMIVTDPSGMGYLTIKKPAPAGTVDVAAYWDGFGGGTVFGSHASAFVTANFLTNNEPSIASYYSMTFPIGTGPVALSQIVLVDALVSSFFTTGQALRIRIPAGLDATWNTAVTTPSFTVDGNGTVNGTVSYPDSKTLRIAVTGTFTPVTAGVTPSKLTIGGGTMLAFSNLNSASAGHLELSWDNGATYQAVDDRIYTILGLNPFITAVETCDLNNDGYIDALHVTFNKNMKDTTIAAAATGFAVSGASGLAFSSTTNGDTANDNDIYLTFTDGVLKSGQTVQLSYDTDVVGANVTDNDGTPNALPDQGPFTAIDRAGPAILSARTRTVTTVELTLSEAVDDTTVSGADFTFSGFATGGANAAGIGIDTGSTANDNIVVVTLAAPIGVAETGLARFTAAGAAGDAAGNTNTQTGTVAVTAGISPSPMLLKVSTTDANSNGYIDGIRLEFTKGMKDSTFISTGDFTVAGATVSGFSTGGTANDTVEYLTLADGVLGTGTTPVVTYTAGSVTDNDPTPVALPSQPAQAAADKAGPAILSARTYSQTQVEITLSEPVADSSIWGGDFTFSGFTTGGANAAGTGFATGAAANDNVILVTLAAAIGVSETGNVKFTNGGYVMDLAGNANTQTAPVAVADGISGPPAILYAETADLNGNGFLGSIKLVFNRNMNDSTFTTTGWFTVAGGTVTGFYTGTTANDNVMYLVITDGVLGSGSTPNVSYTPGTVRDVSAVALAAYAPTASLDRTGPAIVSARTVTVNTVEITFSESVDDTTVSAADFIFSGFGTPAANGQGAAFSTGSASGDTVILITLPAPLTNIAYTGFVSLSAAGLLKDLFGSPNTQATTVAVTASIPALPVMTSVETVDLNGNGYLDAVHVIFSANMNDGTITAAAGGFTVTGAGALAFSSTTNGDTAGDSDVYLTFADGVLASGSAPAVSYNSAGGVKDALGNSMATHAAPATIDKAGPAILSARTLNVTTVQVTFSENVADSSVTGSDFTFSGFATLSANGQGIGFSTGGTPNDNVVIITLPAPIGNTETGSVRFTNVGSVADVPANGSSQTAAVAVNDGIIPVVTGVSSTSANGLFKLGDVLTVQVSFSKPVTVAGGTPTLTLETGAVDRTVSYTAGTGTATLSFSYTVGAGDINADLDYGAAGSLSANGATIRDAHSNDATLTLAAPGAAGSLGANKNLDVDGVVPVITGVSATNANGLFKLGDVLTVQVSFSKPVTVAGGTPTLTLETGAVDRTISYTAGSGTATLSFSYTVAAGDINADLDYVAAGSLSANGATIRDSHSNDATLTLAAPGAAGSLAANKNLDVDAVAAVVTGVSAANADGLFKLGSVLTVQVTFSKPVTIAGGTPTLTLETGAVDRTVNYTAGTGTATLSFSYTVAAGDINTDLDYVAAGSLSANGATIRDGHLNDATLTLAAPGAGGSLAANKNLDVDGVVPVITGVSATNADGLFKLGDVLTVQVTFNKPVTIAGGTPTLTLETGAVDRTVNYTAGTGTATLSFSYTVGAGDINADLDYVAAASLSANGATIRDSHLNDATLTLAVPGAAGSLAANKNLDVDGVVPVITGVSASNANGLFKLGDVLTVQVSFSKPVTVSGGTPTLTLETGAVDRTISYTAGTGTATLSFTYTVGAGDVNADLDYVAAGSLSANGATMRDSHLNDATLTLAAPGAAGSLAANKNLDVDGVVPVITGVSATNANGLFKLGDVLTVQVSFNKPVTVAAGTPTLTLETGAVDRTISYTAGTGTATLSFTYTVGAGDVNADLDYVAAGSLSANGATMRDSHLNNATLTLAAPGAAGSLAANKNLDVDGVVPVITGVSATNADGLFKLGDVLTVQVSFSKPVTVAGGTPSLTLETGAVDRTVSYAAGSGTATLSFSYTVGAGDINADLDYVATVSLSGNGATIRDSHSNDATLTLAAPGAAGSLAANKNLDVDGVVPVITGVSATNANGLFKLGDVLTVQVTFNKPVTVAGGTPTLALETGAVDRTVNYTAGTGTATLSFSYTVGAGDINADLDYVAAASLSANGATIRDSHSNDATLTLAAPGAAGSLAANKNLDVDGVVPVITSVSATNANGLFKLGDALTVQVTFNKPVTVAGGTPTLTLETGAVDRTVNYTAGSGTATLSFSYIVGAGDINADLDYVAAASLSANGATIRDSHSNDATLTLAAPGAAGSLAANKNLDVDGVVPVITGVSATNADGLFKLGDVVTLQVSFSKPVTVAGGTPTLTLETGTVDRAVNYTAGSGTATLSFSYTVAAGDINGDLDYVGAASLSASGATIRDGHSNDATLTLAAPGAAGSLAATKNLDVDGVVPVITGVSATNANGLFKLGDVLTVQVSFSKPVTVAGGTPTLTLETGAVDRTVSYTAGSGSATLSFSYTVGAGDTNADLDYVATVSLSAGGATIRDSHSNDATLTLAAPGAAGSLAANKNLDVDGIVPLITGVSLPTNAYVDVQMSEGVYHAGGSPLASPDLALVFVQNGGNATAAAISSLTTTSNGPLAGGESVIRVNLSVTGVPSGLETIAVSPAGAGSVFDLAGNAMPGAQSTTAVALIPSSLTIVARATQDSNGDGFIDQVRITTLQNLNDSFAGLTVTVAGYTVAGYATGVPGDNVFYVTLARGASFDTGATPVVRVTAGGSLKSAGGLYAMAVEPAGTAATDAAPPVLGVTLAAVGGTRFYVEFSEPVTPLVTGDFTYAPLTGIVALGPDRAFLTVAAPLLPQNVTTDTFAITANAIHDLVGLPVGAATRPISQLMLNVVDPVFAQDGIHTDVPVSKYGALKVFDGTGKLMDTDITLEARYGTATWPVPLSMVFDAGVPSSLKPLGFWLPAAMDGLAPADPASRAVVQTNLADVDQLRDFTIPASDGGVAAGNTIEFLFSADFGAGTRYCLRVLDPNDPRTVRPYAFKISDIQRQRGGVTIVENVINPGAGDKTRLSYNLSKSGRVTIQVFTLSGDVVNTLYAGFQAAGEYSASWDGRNRAGTPVSRNIYFIKIVAPDIDEIRKVLVVR
jgi:hypothetical protein